MGLDQISSDRLRILRFPLIVGVVLVHAYRTEVATASGKIGVAESSAFSNFVRDFISQGLARTAVPLFFLMSGYFLFLGFTWSVKKYQEKLRSRTRTLLIPFLFWNILTLMVYLAAQTLPAVRPFVSGQNNWIETYGPYDYLNAIIGIDQYPVAYQFWFIRDLMVMVVLSPIVYFSLRALPSLFLAVVFGLWYSQTWPLTIPDAAAVAFFSAGAAVALRGGSLFALDRYGSAITVAYLVVLVIDVLTKREPYHIYIHNAGIVLGVASALFLTRAIAVGQSRLKEFLLWAGSLSFFVFAVHEPMLTIFRKVFYKVLQPKSDLMVLGLYFAIPMLVIAIAILVYQILNRVAPRFLSVITGGR